MGEIRRLETLSKFTENEIALKEADVIERVAKVLNTTDLSDLDHDSHLLEEMDRTSEDPLYLIASIFKEVLLSFGIDAESAEKARKTFFALKSR